ncbi:MAG: Maf and M48 domain-containing protein [Candidatus Omnitrophota bacterium]
MRKIYLASDSKARKKLLKIFGLKFKVLPAKIKEKTRAGRFSYPELVKSNALKKAAVAAAKVKSGIIIAADTIVVMSGKVFGKPKDLNGARRMLKTLSGKPQWLYTGIAVIDKDNKKIKTACEKTKIYMDRLTDKEISNYFSAVSPLDKAGSFDIQGKGAFFIRRIEGCFYNVVGLPLRRLYLMLKSLDVKVFILLFCLCLAGCTTEYNVVTGEEETYFYSTDREVAMGESIDREVGKEYKFVDDPLIQKRVEDIGQKIAAVCDRKEITYHFKVLDEEEINAVSLPGGFVYVYKGLVEKVDNDDELAGVLAHEVGHIVARHSIKRLQGQMGYSFLRLLMAVVPQGGGEAAGAADAAFTELIMGYSREDELLADQLGTRYAKLAGYNPRGMLDFLEKLQEVNKRRPLAPKSYYKTHPYAPDRMRVVKQELGEGMDFNDYINIEQTEHGVKYAPNK